MSFRCFDKRKNTHDARGEAASDGSLSTYMLKTSSSVVLQFRIFYTLLCFHKRWEDVDCFINVYEHYLLTVH